jgi:NADPH:quinone reductase-like Zn-dependent oxidoreductase
MARAVRFDQYGGIEVLDVREVETPAPGPDQLLVRVKAAGINPGEAKIREGLLDDRWPATFPSGQGSDLAGVVEQIGAAVNGVKPGDEVIGFTHARASQAEFVLVDAENATRRPAGVPWEVAGALFVVGTTAYAAVRAVSLEAGDTVVVSGAAGGVGSLTVQLARNAGATVIGLASERNHQWLHDHGAIPVTYGDGDGDGDGDGVADRIREAAAGEVQAFIDTVGGGYVQLALELGVQPDRIDTIVDFQAPQKYGVKSVGNSDAASAEVLAHLAGLIERGELELPIAAVYPLAQVREAYTELERGHTHGKIVLTP